LLRARLVEDLRETPAQLPGLEERIPVDERLDALERDVVEHADAEERRRLDVAEVEHRTAAPRLGDRQDRPVARARGLFFAQPVELRARVAHQRVALVAEER